MSIIDDKNKVKSNWQLWENVGDKIEGTLVSKRVVFNQLKGEDQVVYEVKTEDGEYWNVGGKPAIDAQMKRVVLGQIVGFVFTKLVSATRRGYNPTKIIQVYANPEIVDEEWLQQHEEEVAAAKQGTDSDGAIDKGYNDQAESEEENNDEGEVDVDEVFSRRSPQKSIYDKEEPKEEDETDSLLESICQLSQDKFGVSDPDEIKSTVMEATNLAFIPLNFEKIIEELEKLPNKKSSVIRKSLKK